jgi:hypothetical protein
MHRFVRAALLASCLLAAAAPLAHAMASTMSYQGVLTDGGGNLVPDGNYNLTFRIWDSPVAGSMLWSEAHVGVPVTKGGFSLVLGSIDDLNLSFFGSHYLGIQVGADPELAPRVELTSTPSAMSVWMRGTAGNVLGEFSWLPPGFGDGGGYLHLFGDNNTGLQTNLEPDFNGDGTWLWLRGAGFGALNWDGNAGGGGALSISGPSSASYFYTSTTGDNSVNLPADAISSPEILDEPGIAQGHTAYGVDFTSTSGLALTDVVSTTIQTPAAGYVVVEADAQVLLWPGGVVGIQISETPGAAVDDAHYFFVGTPEVTATYTYVPSSIRRTYYLPAGAHTFYFQGYQLSNPGGTAYAWNPTITAQYFPTGYGTVNAIVSAADASSFERATPVAASTGALQKGSGGATVDLRELELRVRREEARLAESRLQLQAARVKAQQDASLRASASKRGGADAPAPKEER